MKKPFHCHQPDRIKPIVRLAAVAAIVLQGCSETDPGIASGDSQGCDRTKNLLQNSEFAQRSSGGYKPWTISQHAGEPSFDFHVSNNTLRVEKTGTQPWFKFAQSLSAEPLLGQDLFFTADVRFDLSAEALTHNFKPGGGLHLSIAGRSPIKTSNFEHEPHLGTTDWITVSTRMHIPYGANRVSAGFSHYANGWIEIRKPALFRCEANTD